MKNIVLGFIVAGLLLQSFSKVGILLNYRLNKDFISKNFCENKNKPALHCNGKCHLAKQLKNVDTEDSKSRSQGRSLLDSFNLISAQFAYLKIQAFGVDSKFDFIYSNNYSFQPSGSFFHPPCA